MTRMEALGIFYQLGQGVKQDRVEAQTWYYIAAELSPKFTVNAKYMSEADLKEARNRADAWLANR
jgi:TPR repeat protein